MRVIAIHNTYKQAGGEDVVFRTESDLLSRNGHDVEQMLFDNSNIRTWSDKLLTGALALYNPISAKAIQKRLESFRPDVIHVYNFTPLVSPSVFFVASSNSIPVVFTVQNYRLLCPSGSLFYNNSIYEKSIHSLFPWDAVWKGVYRNSKFQTAAIASVTAFHNLAGTWRNRVDRYIVLTHFAKAKLRDSRLSIPEDKLAVKPNCVEERGKGLSHREEFFLFVGRLTEEKGVRTLLDGAAESNCKLVMIGDGPLRELVQKSVSANPRLTYLGFKDRDTIFRYLKACRALLFPSIWYEGLPMTILEAFSTGTLVIASKLGAMAEVIQNQGNGLLFEPGNAHDLAMKIADVIQRPDESRRVAEMGHVTYLDRYTPEKNYEQLIEIYRRVIAEKKDGNRTGTVARAREFEHSDN